MSIKALFLSPLFASLPLIVWAFLFRDCRLEPLGPMDGLVLTAVYLFVSYLAAFVVGVPMMLLFRWFGLDSAASMITAGALAGLLFCFGSYGITYGFSHALSQRSSELAVSAIAGMLFGLVFRLLVRAS